MSEIPQVQEKAPKPPGLLPKHVQTWLLVGLAFLMVAIMWLTGGKKPQTPGKTGPPAPLQTPVEVNETKIAELQNRIEELQRQQLAAQNALAQQTRLLGSGATEPTRPLTDHPQDPVAAERARRAYSSLFASNVALSYRTQRPSASAGEHPAAAERAAPSPENAEMAGLLKNLMTPPAMATSPSVVTTPNQEQKTTDPMEERKNPLAGSSATGKAYVLLEGTILESVLINRLDGQFSGPVECLVSTDVYSHDRQHLLIPAGSKLLGETKRVDTFGQTRLAVVFHRLITPDGYSASLDRFQGLNQIGDAGLRDEVNNHYLRIFGASLAIGALEAVAEAGTAGALNASGSDLLRRGFAESTAQSSAQILDKFLNILPTVTIREGHRVKVYLSTDLALPDYTSHTMPANL
jgi:type IV secretion system protein VirB10